MDFTLQGTNLDLTPKIRTFLDEKLEDCFRTLGDTDRDAVTFNIELEKTTRQDPGEEDDQRRYRAEAMVSIPGREIRAVGSEDDIFQSIVQMKHRLLRQLRDWREKRTDERREGAREAKHLREERHSEESPTSEETTAEERYADEIGDESDEDMDRDMDAESDDEIDEGSR